MEALRWACLPSVYLKNGKGWVEKVSGRADPGGDLTEPRGRKNCRCQTSTDQPAVTPLTTNKRAMKARCGHHVT